MTKLDNQILDKMLSDIADTLDIGWSELKDGFPVSQERDTWNEIKRLARLGAEKDAAPLVQIDCSKFTVWKMTPLEDATDLHPGFYYIHKPSGNIYLYLGNAKREADSCDMVIYKNLYHESTQWVRPLKEFLEKFELIERTIKA